MRYVDRGPEPKTEAAPASPGDQNERADRADHAERSATAPASAVFHKGSARMFESAWLEKLSRVHPATPAVLFLPVIAVALWVAVARDGAGGWQIAGQMAAGYVAWTLLEYWLHRLFFHLPVRGRLSQRVYFFVHGVHHDWPWDTSRLVMPPSVSVLLAGLFYGLFRLFLGPDVHALFAGFVCGYVIYDTVHWYTHVGAPHNRALKFLRKQHLVHHFKEPDTRFGVSCPWWDVVFRTTGR